MENTEPICRICLLHPKTETLLTTDSDFSAQIEQCTGVLLTQDERTPNKICTSCALLLRAAIKLRTMCQQAEEQLRKVRQEQQKLHLDEGSETHMEFVESFDVMLETDSITGSQCSSGDITIKAITPTVPTYKPKRRSRNVAGSSSTPERSEGSRALAISYVCNICSNVYTEKVKLTAHLKLHSVHKPHECEICHKRFRQTPQLARHMNSHTGLRPYKCDYCDASFADPSTRIKHQRIHTNERPYKCKYCNKSFAYSNVLNVHLKIHTGERPFSCKYCGRRFSQSHHKNTHERSHKVKQDLDIVVNIVEE